MIKSSLNFTYNGVDSRQLSIINCNISSSGSLPYSEPFLSTVELKQTLVRRHKIPYVFEIRHHVLEFKLQIAFTDVTMLPQIARLFTVNYYAPLIFNEMPERIFYCMPNNESTLNHTGTDGYIDIDLVCSSPYAYTPVRTTQLYDYSSNPAQGSILTFFNQGDLLINPVIIATAGSGGTFTITNTTNNNQFIGFTGLVQGEIVTIDCLREDILSSLSPDSYRYNNLISGSEVNFEMLVGNNSLLITGNVQLQFQYEFVILQSTN